jgi:hypothetical protein
MTESETEEVKASGTSVCVKLRFPERFEDNDWTRADDTKPVTGKNKVKTEDMTRESTKTERTVLERSGEK